MSPVAENGQVVSVDENVESKAVEDAKVFSASADRLVERGSYNMAVYMYDEALKCSPDNMAILMSRSLAYMLSEPPEISLAKQDVERCLELEPENWQAWQLKGDLLMRDDNFEEAEPAFRNAIIYSSGMDRIRAQRSLADARSRFGTTTSAGLEKTSITRTMSIAREPPEHAVTPTLPEPVESITTEPESASIRPEDQEPAPSQRLTRTESRIAREPVIQRSDTFDSVRQAQAQAVPLTSAEILELRSDDSVPDEAPPEYSPRTEPPTEESTMSAEEMIHRSNEFQEKVNKLAKGSLVVKGYTGTDAIDGVVVLLAGLPLEETLSAEQATPALHPSFKTMTVSRSNFPGNTFNDMDAEAEPFYAAKFPGTILVAGFDHEYREQQLREKPHVNLVKQSEKTLPVMKIESIMKRLQQLKANPTLEDDEGLKKVLGLSMLDCLTTGFRASGTRLDRIETICTMFTHSVYEQPDRFVDLNQSSPFNYIFDPQAANNTRDFFYQILIGAELLIRLRKEPALAEYPGVVTDHLSTAMVLAASCMEGVSITENGATADTPVPKYMFFPVNHQRQAEALLTFAEAISWPYLDEARNQIENAFMRILNSEPVAMILLDWFFGMVVPGKIFRHRAMSCLLFCSPSVEELGIPTYWNEGVVIKGKSYWPQRTILGSVFGAQRSSRQVCGWVGPAPAPVDSPDGFYSLRTRNFDVPVPAKVNNLITILSQYFTSPTQMALSITNADAYIKSSHPPKPSGTTTVVFKSYKLDLLPSTGQNFKVEKEYRPVLLFEIGGKEVSYTLYSRPMFIAAPACREGPHIMHEKVTQFCMKNIVHVKDLKEISITREDMLVIYTLSDQEELVARAWCSERGRHAVVRRDDMMSQCCFACAAGLTVEGIGLGTNVLIWNCGA